MSSRWAFILLSLVLLAACTQQDAVPIPADRAASPQATPTQVVAPPPTFEWLPTAVRVEQVPVPTATRAPIPTPTALPPLSQRGVISAQGIVYSIVTIPPPEGEPDFLEYLATEMGRIHGLPLPHTGLYTLEEMILYSDVVARVSLASKRTSVAKRPDDDLWGALLEFRFTVHEYLKGTGPNEIGGIVYIQVGSEATAREVASQISDAHDARWDNREAIVFLNEEEWDSNLEAFPTNADQYWIGAMTYATLEHGVGEAYTVASIYRKSWLPESSGSSGADGAVGASSTTTEKVFLLDAPAGAQGASGGRSTTTAPTIRIGALKSKITTLEAEANAGGTPEYRACVLYAYNFRRGILAFIEREGSPLRRSEASIASGQPAGTVLYKEEVRGWAPNTIWTAWYDGPDKEIVEHQAVDIRLRPGHPEEIIYTSRAQATRPLPAGTYTFYDNWRKPHCDKRFPEAENQHLVTLTVTSPPDTLHEAFFDPADIGSAVGADNSNGVLEPNAFSLDGTTTTISSLKWESGTATMTLDPSASLAGYAVDLIALDGSVTSTLAFDDATQSGGTLTWSVPDKPWNAGDLLMLRIAARPSIAISGLDASIEEGDSDAFTVSASNMATTTSYGIRVTTDDSDIGFDATCADRQQDTTVTAASTSHSAAFTLHACSTTGGTVTATLLEGTTAVATTTQDVTVTAPPPPPQNAPAPAGLSVDSSTESSLSLSWDTVQDIYRYKLERSSTGVAGWSRVVITGGTSHTLSDLSCATTVHFRVSARGDGSPYSTTFGTPSTGSVSGTTGDCTSTTTPVSTPTAPSPPAFASTTYSFAVSENASAFQAVGTVSAVDPDGGTVTHSIVAGNGAGKFEIAGNTGEIIVWGALDYDATSSYALTVRATDSSGATSTATVNISITDVP